MPRPLLLLLFAAALLSSCKASQGPHKDAPLDKIRREAAHRQNHRYYRGYPR